MHHIACILYHEINRFNTEYHTLNFKHGKHIFEPA